MLQFCIVEGEIRYCQIELLHLRSSIEIQSPIHHSIIAFP